MARILVGLLAALTLAAPARADVAQAVDQVIRPAYAQLAGSAATLADAARADCDGPGLAAPFQAVWDDWAAIDFLRLGPVEQGGRAQAISFWPDVKSSGLRAQQALIDADAPAIDDPAAFADLSVALRGLAGLERLIYPSRLRADEGVRCRMIRATADDLARMTAGLRDDWQTFAPELTQPGQGATPAYLTRAEAEGAIFTQIVTGLGALADTRLGRPLGTFDKPHPDRAEAAAAGRSMANVIASLTGMQALTRALHDPAPRSQAGFDQALALARALPDDALARVDDPQIWLKVEILQQRIQALRDTVQAEVGGALNLSVGFNARDGD
ncbi:imelysin family protein [Paracoccus sp. p4-l81]|uniref:imelysin family protein n=1 Tax=Paracoccus sp. p4-l81 TaxID=3342806 RepID=UPI0035B9BF68